MLKGKSALITGSTSGIGLGIARALAAKGANVMLNGFGDNAVIKNIRADIENKYAVKACYNRADMTKPVEIEALVKETSERFGAVDILVNCAGIQHTAQ
ncbi:MAG: SDR family NAD(P)-dependent oxidoreductase [Geobacteraceae bacterium]|nr:SDR family NAD(P)-dependent oxidoreductase [Geobacteraceae bacterium]